MNAPVAQQQLRPRRTGYLIAVLVFLLGAVPSVLLLVSGISGLTKGLVGAEGPGHVAIELDQPGTWTVFYEYRVANGPSTYVSSPEPPPMQVILTSESGAITGMDPSTGQLDYNTGTRSGTSIGSFRIDEPGRYDLDISYLDDGPEQVFLALGHEKGKAAVKTVFGVIGIAVSGAIGLIIFIIVLILRVRAKNRLERASVGPAL